MARPFRYRRGAGERETAVECGRLRGLSPGTILAVRRPAGAEGDAAEILGYVRVEGATPTTASVSPAPFGGKGSVDAQKLPDLARCEPVSRSYGSHRLKLFVEDAPKLVGVLTRMAPQAREMIDTGVQEAQAEWILRVVSPRKAEDEFAVSGLGGDHVLLIQGRGRKHPSAAEEARSDGRARVSIPEESGALRKVFAAYPAGDPAALAAALERDLPKIFKWRNVWKISGAINAQDGAETHGLKFEVATLKDENDRSGGELLRTSILRDGQEMEFRLKNDGTEDLWVTVLYLSANLGIEHYWSGSLRQGSALKPFRTTMTVKDNSTGVEGMIVFALPLSVQKVEPDFHFLKQQPLRVPDVIKRGLADAPDTPFGMLMAAAAFNGGTREMEKRVPTTPAILSQSWLLIGGR